MTGRAWGLLAFALVLLFTGAFAKAETVAATSQAWTTTPANGWYISQNGPTVLRATPLAACQLRPNIISANRNSASDYSCVVSGGTIDHANKSCPSGFTASYTYTNPALEDVGTCYKQQVSYVCPASGGWTLSGTNCTRPDCVAPATRDSGTGACVVSCPTAGSNAMVSGAQAWGITGSSLTCTNGISFGGCQITCTAGVSSGGKASCTGCTFTGAVATTADAAADPTTGEEVKAPTKPEECLAKGQGYVTTSSGTTCVAQDQASEPISTKTTETTTTKNGSGVTTGTEETTVECIGDKCTTTSTTKDGAGVTTGTTTSTGTGDKSGTDPTEEKQSECDKHPETIGCSQYGTPTEDGPLTTNAVGTSSLSPALSSAGSCPADINLPRGMKFSWEYPCMYANGIRPVVIALAWLSAGFLLFGMRLD